MRASEERPGEKIEDNANVNDQQINGTLKLHNINVEGIWSDCCQQGDSKAMEEFGRNIFCLRNSCTYPFLQDVKAAARRKEKRNSTSMHIDEYVQHAVCTWLNLQAASTISPKLLLKAVNDNILPSLNIHSKFPLCECTAY